MEKEKCTIHTVGFETDYSSPKLYTESYVLELKTQLKKQKEIIDKTINAIDIVIELIKQQPTEDDSWILDRLNGFKIILEDKEV